MLEDAPVRRFRLVNAVPVEDHEKALDRAEKAEASVKELSEEVSRLRAELDNVSIDWKTVYRIEEQSNKIKRGCKKVAKHFACQCSSESCALGCWAIRWLNNPDLSL